MNFSKMTGVVGDYNQYRAEVLMGARARAVSILTSDVTHALRAEGWAGLGEVKRLVHVCGITDSYV